MSELTISRRGLLAGSALLLASTAMPTIGFAQTPKKGGRLVLAADSEPRNLNPAIVASHLLISMALVSASTVLVRRHRRPDGVATVVVRPQIVTLSRALVAMTVVVLALGVVVTGAGPHSGDTVVGYRFAVDPVAMAKVHAGAVWLFLGVLGAILVAFRGQQVPPDVRRSAFVLVGITLLQGVIGYVQYATGLPAALVGIHMVAAALLTVAVTWFVSTLRVRA